MITYGIFLQETKIIIKYYRKGKHDFGKKLEYGSVTHIHKNIYWTNLQKDSGMQKNISKQKRVTSH